jgi:hypothetical protein
LVHYLLPFEALADDAQAYPLLSQVGLSCYLLTRLDEI